MGETDDTNDPPARKIRQAVVVVHGMGEQRPLETVNEFIAAGLAPDAAGRRLVYSRPDKVTDSYESRRYLAPAAVDGAGDELRAQTEFFEYHWAHLMQDNRLDDLWPVVRRVALTRPWLVPHGLKFIWALFWGLFFGGVALFFWLGPGFSLDLGDRTIWDLLAALVGGGLWGLVLTYVLTRWIPRFLRSGFVDVVRYLDSSPRSYAVRRDIRAGMLALLQGLHDDGRYQRIIIVAHSLGSYIAYDAITYLWGQFDKLHAGPIRPDNSGPGQGIPIDGLAQLERSASTLRSDSDVTDYQERQNTVWLALRRQGNPWLITDFISVGSPMYMADRIYTRDRDQFLARVAKRELPTCPPQTDAGDAGDPDAPPRFSWNNRGRQVLYHGAPFAVVRWTNMWFPAHRGVFGDWFGGALRPLFGHGIRDIALLENRPRSRWPAIAHALYYHFGDDTSAGSVTTRLREAMSLNATAWLLPTADSPAPDPRSVLRVDAPLPEAEAPP